MEKRNNFLLINFAFLVSILVHIYIIFFLTKVNINLIDKKDRITISLSALGILEEAPKESIKKEKIIKHQVPEIKKIKKKTKKKIKKKIDIKKTTLPQEKSVKRKKTKEKAVGGTASGIEGGESKITLSKYVTQVYKLIDSKKKYPRQSLIRREEGIVMLEIVIRKDGRLKSMKSVTAKYQRLVDSSFDAVEAAAPFPPFPNQITRERLVIQVPVIYKIR